MLVGFRDYDSLDLFQLMNRYLRQVGADLDLLDLDQRGLGPGGGGFREEGDHLVLEMEVPGVRKEDIEISAQGQTLSIRARFEDDAPEGYRLLRRERMGAWQTNRSWTIPTVADGASVKCNLKNGILTVQVQKQAKTNPRRIAVDAQEV